MMKEALSYFPMPNLPLVGLFLFAGVFIGVVLWTGRSGARKLYDRTSRQPLDGEES